MKVYAKVKCDICSGTGKVLPLSDGNGYLRNPDGTDRCTFCNGQGEVKKWVEVNLEIINEKK